MCFIFVWKGQLSVLGARSLIQLVELYGSTWSVILLQIISGKLVVGGDLRTRPLRCKQSLAKPCRDQRCLSNCRQNCPSHHSKSEATKFLIVLKGLPWNYKQYLAYLHKPPSLFNEEIESKEIKWVLGDGRTSRNWSSTLIHKLK